MRHSIQLRFMRKISDFDWDVAPMPSFQAPGGPKVRKAGLEMEFFALTAEGKAPEQAWTVTEYLTGKENISWSSESGFGIPALKSLAESKVFLDPTKPPAKAFLDAFNYAEWRFWRHGAVSELDGAVGRGLQKFLAADATVTAKETLEGLAQELNGVFDQFGRGKA